MSEKVVLPKFDLPGQSTHPAVLAMRVVGGVLAAAFVVLLLAMWRHPSLPLAAEARAQAIIAAVSTTGGKHHGGKHHGGKTAARRPRRRWPRPTTRSRPSPGRSATTPPSTSSWRRSTSRTPAAELVRRRFGPAVDRIAGRRV